MNMGYNRTVKVIIAGSRSFGDYDWLCDICDSILERLSEQHEIVVLSGGAKGSDTMGELYAKERGYIFKRFPPDWNRFGRAAGPIRNRDMADNADILIAFWDGKSLGTKSMIDIAEKRKLQIHINKI